MLALATSGTTSHSKVVLLHHHKFLRGAAVSALHVGRREDDRGLILQPLVYAGGLFYLASTLFTGSSAIFLPCFDSATFFRYLENLSPTWYAGSYTFQQNIHAQAPHFKDAIRRSRLRFIRTSSGHLDDHIADDLETLFGAPVIESYAATEAGWISANPMPPQGRKRGTVGRPIDQEVAILGSDGGFLPAGERGEVVVRGDMVFDGYEDDPAATEAAFVDGWYRTGDEGVFDDEGYLTLTGRIRETINRGGEKIAPAEVDAALLEHPEVREAATFPIPHATLGEEVAAAVVPVTGAGVTDQDLVQFLRRRLAGFKVPRRILVVDAIPKSANGKVQRRHLAQAFELDFTAPARIKAGPKDRPSTPLERHLQEIWARSLGLEHVGVHDDFFLLGGDSLQAVELFLRVEEELGFRLPRSSLFEAGTVAEQASCIEAAAPPGCVVPIQPAGARPPFFCVHYGNGPVLNFRGLARHLGADQPFYGLQYVEPVGDQGPFTRIEAMAAHYLAEVRKVQPEGPYYLGGYSFGGRVAYVMAQQLRAAGEEVALLALLDTYSAVGRCHIGPWRRLARHRERLAELGLGAYAKLVLQRRREAGYRSLARLCSTKLLRSFEQPIPRNLLSTEPIAIETIRRSYRARPYEGSAVLFKAELDRWSHPDRHDGWHQLIKGGLEVRP
ncbi:MAG: AMP-binding protein, partial [Planctomycetota bacterium]